MASKSSVSVLLLCSLAASAAASTMSIVSKSNASYCLDLLGERTQDGTPIDIWKCTAGLLGQQWFFDAGSYKIRSAVNSKKCVDAGDMKAATQLSLKECDDKSTSQLFGWDVKTNAIYLTPDKGDIKPTGSLCMKIASMAQGSVLTLVPCSATDKLQQWSAVVGPPPTPTKNETFFLSPGADPNACLDLMENKTDNGSPVVVSTVKGGPCRLKSQEWIFAEGSYRIESAMRPGKCIDATDMKNGTKLILWDCNGFSQQQWGYQQTKGAATGTVYLTQAPTDESLCLDTSSNMATVGNCIQWRLTRVKSQIIVV